MKIVEGYRKTPIYVYIKERTSTLLTVRVSLILGTDPRGSGVGRRTLKWERRRDGPLQNFKRTVCASRLQSDLHLGSLEWGSNKENNTKRHRKEKGNKKTKKTLTERPELRRLMVKLRLSVCRRRVPTPPPSPDEVTTTTPHVTDTS